MSLLPPDLLHLCIMSEGQYCSCYLYHLELGVGHHCAMHLPLPAQPCLLYELRRAYTHHANNNESCEGIEEEITVWVIRRLAHLLSYLPSQSSSRHQPDWERLRPIQLPVHVRVATIVWRSITHLRRKPPEEGLGPSIIIVYVTNNKVRGKRQANRQADGQGISVTYHRR